VGGQQHRRLPRVANTLSPPLLSWVLLKWLAVCHCIVSDHELRHVMVVLHVYAEKATFKLSRFSVNRNNVRRRWFTGETNQLTDTGTPRSCCHGLFTGFSRFLESPGFFVSNSRTWKVLENHFGPGKSWKLKFKVLESPGKTSLKITLH